MGTEETNNTIEIVRQIYQDDYYKLKGHLNHSMLCIYQEDPVLFWDLWYGRKEPDPESAAMAFGKMVHSAILTPEEFQNEYSLMEGSMPKSINMEKFCEAVIEGKTLTDAYMANYRVLPKDAPAKAKELYNELKGYIRCKQEGKPPISEEDMSRINTILTNYKDHQGVQEVINKGDNAMNELEVRFQHDCGLPCKSKLDRIQWDMKEKRVWIIDLKTSSHNPTQFVREVERGMNSYLQQLAYYTMAMKETYHLYNDWIFEYYLIYIGSRTCNVYLVRVGEILEDRIWKIDEDICAIHEKIERGENQSRVERIGVDFETRGR
ncbi:PD-(D/E)XK nuclease-like domain-containing protein [Candidatus Azobacteroides pseudotrichonymphae]|uniref:PD-(D/E)XK endonuclease-like domain-containing protein n=1 Tax=Azobacteroides pseudotrichonymphae genomovar. CFP2 TaxID=511995 RepID=B6YS92_AZOPC|nr:PD-(D/E)XK nuclease-like domain-containing protein [Candidatus Azobacteroides pseudotrichonymphae]BAG84064.1 hypothetical protein CFPG_P2-6 [Candidatus Azobacteroides pseudotrichonymphae genomovar. CFP2]